MLFYGYATGVFSSRKLELATYDSVAFRFITADTHPDHDTLASFRKRFVKELEGLFVQILVIAQTMDLLKLGHVSIDGTKMKANASKHKALSWRYANRLKAQLKSEVSELLRRAEAANAEAKPDLDIPDELTRHEARLAAIAEAKAEIERRTQARYEAEKTEYEAMLARREERAAASGGKPSGRAPKPPEAGPREKDQVNLTDAKSRIMPSSEGFVQAYNAQAAVDVDTHLMVGAHLTQQPNDQRALEPALKRLKALPEALGSVEGVFADAGYCSEANMNHCEANGCTPAIGASATTARSPRAT